MTARDPKDAGRFGFTPEDHPVNFTKAYVLHKFLHAVRCSYGN